MKQDDKLIYEAYKSKVLKENAMNTITREEFENTLPSIVDDIEALVAQRGLDDPSTQDSIDQLAKLIVQYDNDRGEISQEPQGEDILASFYPNLSEDIHNALEEALDAARWSDVGNNTPAEDEEGTPRGGDDHGPEIQHSITLLQQQAYQLSTEDLVSLIRIVGDKVQNLIENYNDEDGRPDTQYIIAANTIGKLVVQIENLDTGPSPDMDR